MAIPKKIREAVYAKFDGHCAYCGCEITMKDMQVDHIQPVMRNYDESTAEHYGWGKKGTDDLDNLNPSCRQCNFYKGMGNIEDLRRKISSWLDYKHTFATKLALKYGILVEHKWDGQFYFEKVRKAALEAQNTEYDYGHNVCHHPSEE